MSSLQSTVQQEVGSQGSGSPAPRDLWVQPTWQLPEANWFYTLPADFSGGCRMLLEPLALSSPLWFWLYFYSSTRPHPIRGSLQKLWPQPTLPGHQVFLWNYGGSHHDSITLLLCLSPKPASHQWGKVWHQPKLHLGQLAPCHWLWGALLVELGKRNFKVVLDKQGTPCSFLEGFCPGSSKINVYF